MVDARSISPFYRIGQMTDACATRVHRDIASHSLYHITHSMQ